MSGDVIDPGLRGQMWADLFTTDLAAQSAVHHVTTRALIYLQSGPIAERAVAEVAA